ncbi:helix-turn-helix domain-containing protein [Paenibacillus sp. P96]|uniref:Helix-turn-helix domain-containing protein n=1 Tax=Paenibacillus zeirhizosphaerae TaxID=2987519 RepID=A0ABT9FV16_9BACL|nr:PRD domain-containing protein [Paenibacillus sp. P96]MDP4098351.1 helix-turn-helix domain-containing protein [Paenibacillus sp. P96]
MTMVTRTRALLKKILYTPNPVRIKDCASEFGVSERTIKYDIESIRMWLASEGVEIKSKPSTGIWIECPEEERDNLLRKMDADKDHNALKQQERIQYVTMELLLRDGETTIGRIASHLGITRNTALSDLVQAELLLREWDLQLERSRKGVKITGSGVQKRLVLEQLVYSLLDGSDMLQIVQSAASRQKPRIHFTPLLEQFLQPADDLNAVFSAVGDLVEETERCTGVLLSDQAVIGIFIRLCIVISSNSVTEQSTEFDRMPGDEAEVFDIFRRVLSGFSQKTGGQITDQDIWFVCLQAVSRIPAPADSRVGREPMLPDALVITRRLIEAVSRSMDPDLARDPDLFSHLLAHTSRKLTQYSYGVVEPNPMLQDIISAYRGMFESVKSASIEVYGPYRIYLTDSDIGYIVVYFQLAYERLNEQRSIRGLVVCGTGKGTSRLLKTVIEKRIPNLSIDGSCSVMELNKMLQEGDYDLVISVFPVDVPVPSVVVSPIPGKRDFEVIQEKVTAIAPLKAETPKDSGNPLPPSSGQIDDPEALQSWFQEMVFRGFELGRQIADELGSHLTSDRLEGLKMHLIFMMQRVALHIQYEDPSAILAATPPQTDRERLLTILEQRGLKVSEAELQAILKYLEQPEEG